MAGSVAMGADLALMVVPATTGLVPSMVGVVPSMVGVVPSMVRLVPSMAGMVRSMVTELPQQFGLQNMVRG